MENASPSKSPSPASDAGASEPSAAANNIVVAKSTSPERDVAATSGGAVLPTVVDPPRTENNAEHQSPGKEGVEATVKPRKDSETGGEDAEKNGMPRRNRNDRGGNRGQRDKKWWVCADTSCRSRNSVDAANCVNCGLQQNKRGANRHPYPRSWEKSHVSNLVVTHVVSPTMVYAQTPQQQHDYARLRNCMAMAYASASYRPSLVAAKMMLGMKYGDTYERVRTEQRIPELKEGTDQKDSAPLSPGGKTQEATPADQAPPTTEEPSAANGAASPRWRVQLVDRGSWGEASEDQLNFLLAGLADLAPLASRYSLNELRLTKNATEAQIEEGRLWLEKELSSGAIDADIYKQPRNQSSALFIDLYKGEKYINQALCDLDSVEPKTNFRRLKVEGVRASTSSSADDGAPTSPTDLTRPHEEAHDRHSGHESTPSPSRDGPPKEQRQKRERSAGPSKESVTEEQNPVFQDSTQQNPQESGTGSVRTESTGGGRRGSRWNRRDGRQRQQRLPPLHDWAVLCFDPRSTVNCLEKICELVEQAGKDSRVQVSAADSIQLENCGDDSAMVSALADMIATHPRLLLVLCVLPHRVQDYSTLERTGRSLGVCVVCVRGENISDPNPSVASRLLRDLQTAMLNSPAILPYQGISNYGGGRRRRYNRDRRNQKNSTAERSGSPVSQALQGLSQPGPGADARLQTVFGAASQGVSLLHRLAQPEQGSDASKAKLIVQSAAVQQDVALALKSLDELQTTYKQARAFTHEAFQAAGDFFRHLSNAISPTVS